MAQSKETLMRAYAGWNNWLVIILAFTAFTLQVLALCVPFMQTSLFLAGTTTYGLLNSVQLMWQENLYVIAILIIVFSVVFPFLKLASLILAWTIIPQGENRTRVIRLLGILGKWSMMDPFCVILLIALATNQWAVGADTQPGVYFFLVAVALSMSLSLFMMQCDRVKLVESTTINAKSFRLATKSGRAGVVVPIALIVSMIALYLALQIPFLQIDQFLLSANSFGVLEVCVQLITHNQIGLGVLTWVGLIIVPCAIIGLEWWFWLWPATATRHITRRRFVDAIYEWSMLDVFSLALVLFLLEGAKFIKTEIHPGLWFIVIAVIVSQACRRIARQSAQKCFRRRLDD